MVKARSPLLNALISHTASAEVVDVDHYRIQSGMAIETDYIVGISSTKKGSTKAGDDEFENFKVSKPYSAFRTLNREVKKVAEAATKSEKKVDSSDAVKAVATFSESLSKLIHAEKVTYMGKMSYAHVKSIAKKRTVIINDALKLMLTKFPTENLDHQYMVSLMSAVETFFLTDVCVEEGAGGNKTSTEKAPTSPSSPTSAKKTVKTPEPKATASVVPLSKKTRQSLMVRSAEQKHLEDLGEEENLILDDERRSSVVSYSPRTTNKLEKFDNPLFFSVVFAVCLYMIRAASFSKITIDADIAALVTFAFFCLGMNFPRFSIKADLTPQPVPASLEPVEERRMSRRRTATSLLRRSMAASSPDAMKSLRASLALIPELAEIAEEEEAESVLGSPLPVFPEGAELGSHFNCWSEPKYSDFKIRGPKYLKDKKKIPSGHMLFPVRATDLFLTDTCPENAGSISGVLGGRLRDVPTFIVNFRLPWAILLFYYEIPEKFLPFLRKRYDINFKAELPSLETMSPGDRTACRFLMGDDEHKDNTLKIVPIAVKAPWVVKSVVGGKPAIVGKQLPVTYVYQPAEPEKKKAEYLEMDLDIVASAAARRILSVCRSYTNVLTIDLGFVVQGNSEDELPEQMLCASRLHGIDPMNAPPLPAMDDPLMVGETNDF